MSRHTRLKVVLLISCLTGSAFADETRPDQHHILDEIIVAATPLERTVEELAQPTSVVGGDALVKKQAASIGETLAGELGVSASYFGPVASRPVIRGQFGERVRVLTNGLDSLDASALSEDHAVTVDSILAERVEIVRGPATLLYGSGAAGGLVNVVDSRMAETPLDTAFSGAASANFDTAAGTESGALKLDFGSEHLAVHVDGFRRNTDDIEIPSYAESKVLRQLEAEEGEPEEHEADGVVENTSSATDGLAAAISLTSETGYLGLSVSGQDSRYGGPGHHHDEDGDEEEAVRIGLDQTRYELRGGRDLEGKLKRAELRVARNDYTHVELEGDEVGTRFDTSGTDLRLELRHRSLGSLEGAVGVQYKAIDFRAAGDEAFVPGSDTQQVGLFAFEEYAVNDAWVIQASARIEGQRLRSPGKREYDDWASGASIGSIWSISDRTSLSANISFTERHPNATELFADGPHVAVQRYERGSVTSGAGYFDKEASTNVDVTLRGVTERLEWTITGFLNRVDDYILLSPTGSQIDSLPVFDYLQKDVEMVGFEAEVLVDLFATAMGHLHARAFADTVYGEETVSGEYLPRLPPLRWGIGLHFTTDRADLSVDAAFHSAQDKLAGNELRTASFGLVNAEASYTFADDDLLVYLRGTNLTDADARRHTSPLKDIVPLPGRSLHFGLRWHF